MGATIVDAVSGEFHGAGVSEAGWSKYPLVSQAEAVKLVRNATGNTAFSSVELVWKFCNESKSRYEPFWKLIGMDGATLYVTQDGKLHTQLTVHSCVGR